MAPKKLTNQKDKMKPNTYTCPPSLQAKSNQKRKQGEAELGKDVSNSRWLCGLLSLANESPFVYKLLLEKLRS